MNAGWAPAGAVSEHVLKSCPWDPSTLTQTYCDYPDTGHSHTQHMIDGGVITVEIVTCLLVHTEHGMGGWMIGWGQSLSASFFFFFF